MSSPAALFKRYRSFPILPPYTAPCGNQIRKGRSLLGCLGQSGFGATARSYEWVGLSTSLRLNARLPGTGSDSLVEFLATSLHFLLCEGADNLLRELGAFFLDFFYGLLQAANLQLASPPHLAMDRRRVGLFVTILTPINNVHGGSPILEGNSLVRSISSRQAAKSVQQCNEAPAISITHRREFQAQPATALYMPHDSVGSDLSFLDKKINFGRQT